MSHQSFEDESDAAKLLEFLALPDLSGKTVLDLGCKDGFFAFAALERGAIRVVGIDDNPVSLNEATKRARDLNLSDRATFRQAPLDEPLGELFDVIFLISGLHLIKDQEAFVGKIAVNLKPGGLLIFEGDISPENISWTQTSACSDDSHTIFHYPNRDELHRILGKHFAVRQVGRTAEDRQLGGRIHKPGDPPFRIVFHGIKFISTVLCLQGKAGTGKTTLALLLAQSGVPVLSIDKLTRLLAVQDDELGLTLRQFFKNGGLGKVYREIAGSDVAPKMADALISEIVRRQPDGKVLVVEGTLLRWPTFWDLFSEKLKQQSIVLWCATRDQ